MTKTIQKIIRRGAKNSRVQYTDGTVALISNDLLSNNNTEESRDYSLWYREFNNQMFEGQLPTDMRIGVNNCKTSVGRFCIRGSYTYIELSKHLLESASTEDIKDVLIHEMIHAWQHHVLRMRPNHQSEFKNKMWQINSQFGRNISTTYDEATKSESTVIYAEHMRTRRGYVIKFMASLPRARKSGSTYYELSKEKYNQCKGYQRTLNILNTFGAKC